MGGGRPIHGSPTTHDKEVTAVIHVNGHDVVLAAFSTPYNSIPGSAVCVCDTRDIASVSTGRLKEQKSLDSTWTPVSDG